MLLFYPKKFILFHFSAVCFFVLLIFNAVNPGILSNGMLLLLMLFFLAIMVYAFFSAAKKLKGTMDLLTQQCNPQDFVQEVQKMWKNNVTNKLINVNLSAGYYNLGRFDLMGQALDGCTAFKGNFTDIYHLVIYLNNQIAYHAETKNFEAAEYFLQQLRATIDKPAAASKRDSFYLIYAEARRFLLVQQGNFEGAEDTYLQKFDRAKDLCGKVFAQWMLARTYLAQNRLAEAETALGYVVQHGGGLHIKQLALQELEKNKI